MMKNKSTLAKLLSEEDIFVVHKQMETAYFNSKTRELGLPIWKDEEMSPAIYELMLGHEIGHALWTPLDMLEKSAVRGISHQFVNIIEDARIEKFVKRKYAGLGPLFKRGYRDLIAKDFFGTEERGIESFGFIDRINIFFKTDDASVRFSEKEMPFVERTAKVETEDEVLDLAEDIFKFMEENPESNGEENADDADESAMGNPVDMTDGSGESTGETGEGNAPAGSEETATDDKSKEIEDLVKEIEKALEDENATSKCNALDDAMDKLQKLTQNDGDADDGDADDGEADNADPTDSTTEDGSTEGGVGRSSGGGVPKAETDGIGEKVLDNLRNKGAKDREYAKIPKLDSTKYIVDYKKILSAAGEHYSKQRKENKCDLFWTSTLSEVESLKSDSKKTVAYMVKEFEMKKSADQYARASTAKTGTLDMSKIHTYKFNDDLFKKVTTLPGATNHGLVMVVDWSGSMHENLKGTISQLFNLVWFCRRSQIPFEVFAFSDVRNWLHDDEIQLSDAVKQDFRAGDLKLREFNLLNFFSSKMSISEENNMMHILWMFCSRWGGYRDWAKGGYPYSTPRWLDMGGTPLNDAIITMMDFVPKFKLEAGVQKVNTIFLTDGASNALDGVMDLRLEKDTGEHTETVNNFGRYRGNVESIITDPVTNKTYIIPAYEDITNKLLEILKNRVEGMNVVGFFLAGTGRSGRIDKRTLSYITGVNIHSEEMRDMLRKVNKEKFYAVTGEVTGYDEYYILAGGKSLTPENDTLGDELAGATKAKLKTAFGKMQKSKIGSRVLLNRFVKMVA
jgi:hypothetical protein